VPGARALTKAATALHPPCTRGAMCHGPGSSEPTPAPFRIAPARRGTVATHATARDRAPPLRRASRVYALRRVLLQGPPVSTLISPAHVTPERPLAGRQSAATDSLPRYLLVVGLVFLAVVMTMKPDVGFRAPAAVLLLFWTLQIGVGLLVLQATLHLLTRLMGASRVPSWALVVLSGVLGSVLLAPAYWGIGEGLMIRWWGVAVLPDEEGIAPDHVSIGHDMLAEYGDIVGPVTTAWVLICLPRLHWMVAPLLYGSAPGETATTAVVHGPSPVDIAPAAPAALVQPAEPAVPAATVQPVQPVQPVALIAADPRWRPAEPAPAAGASTAGASTAGAPAAGVSASTAAAVPTPRGWRERLPPEIGRDVIAVASELQYLRVWTPRGCALIVGALADVELEDASHGLRVHRSWWVAANHVSSVRRTTSGAVCVMSNGRRVPVSRRRRAEVLARFGDGARYIVPVASEPVPHPDLHRKRVVAR